MGEVGMPFKREDIRSTDFCDGESSGSPHRSTSALSVRDIVHIVSTCSAVHDDDHTSISGCISRTRNFTSSICSQLAAWMKMYLSPNDSAMFLTIRVAFSGCLLTVINLKGWREPRAVDIILVMVIQEGRN